MIRFFISSTFRDMFGERNLLHQTILPELRAYGETLGEYVEICDLRWGIDHGTARKTDKTIRIMHVCLQEMDKCHPYFIAFLGDYYGTVPKEDICIEGLKGERSFLVHADEMSLTQIELEYAVLQEPYKPSAEIRPICLFRHWKENGKAGIPQEGDAFQRQQELKERLRSPIHTDKIISIDYDAAWDAEKEEAAGLNQMAQDLLAEAKKIVAAAAKAYKPRNWIESEFQKAEGFCSRYTAHFAGRERQIREILAAVREDTIHTVCISGPSGYGKSTLLAKIYQEAPGRKCLVACGYGERSRNYLDVLKQSIYFVERQIKEDCKIADVYSEEKAERMLQEAIRSYEMSNGEKLVLLVDALDKLRSDYSVNLPRLLEGLQIQKTTLICSGIETFADLRSHTVQIHLDGLKEHEITQIISNHVVEDDVHFKDLAVQLSKKKDKGSPLYITAALNILLMQTTVLKKEPDLFGAYGRIVSEMPERTKELVWDNIRAAGKYLDVPLGETLAGYLAAVQEGLRETDLEAICRHTGWRTVDFVRFRYYLSGFFRCQPNGCWTFHHDILKESVLQKISSQVNRYREAVFNYMKTVRKNDEVRIVEGLWASYRLGEYAFARDILEEAVQEADRSVHTRVIVTLQDIARDSTQGEQWCRVLIETYPNTVEKMLTQGMMYDGVLSYERRYPAKGLADLYEDVIRRSVLAEQLKKRMHAKQTLQEKIQFSSFCAEYVGIYEDISRQWEVFPYETAVCELICSQIPFQELTQDQKGSIFKQVNGVFYANNRILNDIRRGNLPATVREQELARQISKEMIRWYEEYVQNQEDDFTGRKSREGLFVNNIAQYYSAFEEYENGQAYRIKAIGYKTYDLLKEIGNESLYKKMEQLLEGQYEPGQHAEYWKEVEQYYSRYLDEQLPDTEEGKKKQTALFAKWTRAAVSYRCIGSDCYNWDRLEQDDKRLWHAYENMKICLDMMHSARLEKNEKEMVMSEILMVGIAARMFQRGLAEDGQQPFVDFIAQTVNHAVQYADFDRRELGKLCANMDLCRQSLPADTYRPDILTEARGRIDAILKQTKEEKS